MIYLKLENASITIIGFGSNKELLGLLALLNKENIKLDEISPITLRDGHFSISCNFKLPNPMEVIKKIRNDNTIITKITIDISSEDYSELNKRIVNSKVAANRKDNPEKTDTKWLDKFKQIHKK